MASGASAGASQSQSTSNSTSTSSTSSALLNSTEAQLSAALASLATQYGGQIEQWAQSTLAPNQALTNQTVGTFQNAANSDFSLANTLSSDYNNMGQPALANLANTANTYSSAPRQQFAAGQAEANSLQGSQAGISNAEQTLTGFGINPNSGMYGELETSNKAAAGAAAAAAGTQAAQNVQQTGLTLQAQNVAAQQQLPGQAANSSTAGVGALTGAANTQFGNTSTAQNALNSPDALLTGAESGIKTPDVGSTSNSTSTSNSQSTSGSAQAGLGSATPSSTAGVGLSSVPGEFGVAEGGAIPTFADGGETAMYDAAPGQPGGPIPQHPGTPIRMIDGSVMDQNLANRLESGQGGVLGGPNANPYTTPYGGKLQINPATGALELGAGPNLGTDPAQGLGMRRTPPGDINGTGGEGVQPIPGASWSNANIPLPTEQGFMNASGGAFKTGGAIPTGDATTGGFVSRHLSPSRGGVTDDIPARLNADEFVMPKDVTKYYGHKTFQDMILKARKALGDPNQSPAHPEMKPALHHAGGGAIPTGW